MTELRDMTERCKALKDHWERNTSKTDGVFNVKGTITPDPAKAAELYLSNELIND
jgi:hypothetical protein